MKKGASAPFLLSLGHPVVNDKSKTYSANHPKNGQFGMEQVVSLPRNTEMFSPEMVRKDILGSSQSQDP